MQSGPSNKGFSAKLDARVRRASPKQIQLLRRGEQKIREKSSLFADMSHPRIPYPGVRGNLPMGNHDDRAAYIARVRSDSALK